MHKTFKVLLFVPLAALLLFAGMWVGVLCVNNIDGIKSYKWVITAALILIAYFVAPYEEKYIWKKKMKKPEIVRELPPITIMYIVGMLIPLWSDFSEIRI
jgi:hypothetical protein